MPLAMDSNLPQGDDGQSYRKGYDTFNDWGFKRTNYLLIPSPRWKYPNIQWILITNFESPGTKIPANDFPFLLTYFPNYITRFREKHSRSPYPTYRDYLFSLPPPLKNFRNCFVRQSDVTTSGLPCSFSDIPHQSVALN